MTTLPLLADPVQLSREALTSLPAVTALVSTRIWARAGAVYPQITLALVDTVEQGDPIGGQARVQCNCWGDGSGDADTYTARLIARTIQANSRGMVGPWTSGRIWWCSPQVAIPAPDPTTGRARTILDLLIGYL